MSSSSSSSAVESSGVRRQKALSLNEIALSLSFRVYLLSFPLMDGGVANAVAGNRSISFRVVAARIGQTNGRAFLSALR
jgi:hypothetical protein